MSEDDSTAETDIEQLDERDARALTEDMTVLTDVGKARGSAGLFTVIAHHGRAYLVDARNGTCECPDHGYRGHKIGQLGCKHQRRVAFATGERSIPGWVDREGVDPDLGEHVEGEGRITEADGDNVDGLGDGGGEGTDGHRLGDPIGDGAGERPFPPVADRDDVDRDVETHADIPHSTATDGGWLVDREGVITLGNVYGEADPEAGDRPDTCECSESDLKSENGCVPCWPCWLAGHESPNPDAPGTTGTGAG